MENNDRKQNSTMSPGKRLQALWIFAFVAFALGVGLFVQNRAANQAIFSHSETAKQSPEGLITPRDYAATLDWIKTELAQSKSDSPLAVINFWATWCEPCRTEMPELVQFRNESGVPVLLISGDNESDLKMAEQFLNESGFRAPSSLVKGDQQVFLDQWIAMTAKTPAKGWSMSLPATYLIDRSGVPVQLISGMTTAKELKAIIKNFQSAVGTARGN